MLGTDGKYPVAAENCKRQKQKKKTVFKYFTGKK